MYAVIVGVYMTEIEELLKTACEAHLNGIRLPVWFVAPSGSGKSRMLQAISMENPSVYYYEGSITANSLAVDLLPRLISGRYRTLIFDDLSHLSDKARPGVLEKFQQIADGKMIMNQFEVGLNHPSVVLNIIISCTPEYFSSKKIQTVLKQTGLNDRFLILNYQYSYATMTRALIEKSNNAPLIPIHLNGTKPRELSQDEKDELISRFSTCRQLGWAMALKSMTDIDFFKYMKGTIEI